VVLLALVGQNDVVQRAFAHDVAPRKRTVPMMAPRKRARMSSRVMMILL
jgi:hypothetical protein